MPSLLEHLRSLSRRQKLGVGLAWAASLVLVAALTWELARQPASGPAAPEVVEASQVEPPFLGIPPPDLEKATPADKEPSPPKPASPRRKSARPAPEPEPPAAEAPVEAVPPPVPLATVLERVERVDRALENDDTEQARQDAAALLSEYPSLDRVANALVSDGVGEIRARLLSVRVLQAAGRDEICRDAARLLRRTYAGTVEVAETIRRWKILRPRVTSVEASSRRGKAVISGTLENPDVASVRSVEIKVEALDAAGNVIGTATTRARPKRLDAESNGTFKATLRGVDPSMVLRTRAWVATYEYEVPE